MKRLLLLLTLSLSCIAQAQLTAPNWTRPYYNATGEMITNFFLWSSVSGASYYEVQIDTINTFGSPGLIQDTSATNTKYIGPLYIGQAHYCRVRAVNSQANGPWSATHLFTTLALPNVISFSTGNGFVASLISTYSVGANFEHEFDTVNTFNSPHRLNFYHIYLQDSTRIYRDLLFKKRYYVRSRIYHERDTGNWSSTKTFVTLGGSAISGLNPNALEQYFTWLPGYYVNMTYPGAFTQFQLDTTNSYNSPALVDVPFDTSRFYDDRFSGRYKFGAKWYARTRTITPVDTSDWNQINWTVFNNPSVVLPTSSIKKPVPLQTQIGSHSGVDHFIYRLDTTSDFSSTYLKSDTLTNIPLSPSRVLGVPHFAKHWYGVRAVAGQDTSDETIVIFNVDDGLNYLAPSNNSYNQHVEVNFSWQNPGNVSFQLQVDSLADFSISPRIYSIPSDTNAVSIGELYYGRKNYWRMRVISSADTGRWLTTRNFLTLAFPAPFYPSNNATNFAKVLELSCDAIHGSDYYEFEIAETADFQNSWKDTARYDPLWDEVSYPLNRLPLQYLTKYYWRVRAMHSRDTSDWSATWNFTTAAELTKPPQVELVLPADKSVDLPLSLVCEWKLIDDVYFWFQLHTSPDFGPGTDSIMIIFIGNVNPTHSLKNLTKGITYYWRVKAVNDEKEGEWSETWSFTTRPNLTTPKPLFPVSLTNQGIYLTLRWSKIPGAGAYSYRIGENQNLTGIIPTMVYDTFVAIGPLKENTGYYWQVNAANLVQQTLFSPVAFFGTGEGTGTAELIDGLKVYPNPAKELLFIESASTGAIEWELTGIDGRLVSSGVLAGNDPVSLDGIPPGMYILRIETMGRIGHYRIIKE